LEPFYNKTGITVHVIAFGEAELRAEMLADLKKGSPYYDGFVGPSSEFFNLIICPDCRPEQRPLIQPLSDWVREDADIAWYDIAAYERTITTVYKGEIYMVPLDADAMLLYYRTDILQQAGFDKPPDTWEEYIQVSQALQDLDMNGDGIPDYATCTGKTNSSKFDLNAYFFMSYVSSYLQYNGTHQGVFFDAETMAPMSNTTAFSQVWSIYKDITRYGPELETDIWTSWDLFAAGRCAMVLTFGDILGIIKNTSVANVTSSTILPGTREIYNRRTNQMETCTADLCPFMDAKGINRAPFATPGYAGYVSRFTKDDRKKAAYDFLSFLAQPAQSQVAVFQGLGQDIFRKSHLNSTLWFDNGYSNVTTVNTINSLHTVLESPNVAIPMPAIEQYAYFTAFTTWNKCYLFDECTLDEAQAGLTRDWTALLQQHGLREQHTLYAVMLGNPEPVYSYQINLSDSLMIGFLCLASFIIVVALFFLFFVVKCRDYKLIRATQPTFHYGTIIGALAMLIGIILVNIQPPINDYCTASLWLVLMGFGLLHANLSAKMFRIWRLSDVTSLEIRVIKDIHLVPFVAGIAALYIVPLAVWTALDPPQLHAYTTNLPPDQYMMICGTGDIGVKIFIVLLSLCCALLLVGCVFAYLNRNVATIYNESRQVAASIYTFSFAAIVLVPMIFTIHDYLVVHITLSAVICFCTLVTLVTLFLFKLLRIIRKGDTSPHGKSSQSHRTSSFTEQSSQLNELKLEVEKLMKENSELREEIKMVKLDTCHQSA
jgi:multiple sugar transport system substrate-binding protein